jgi:hypothetical protein
MWDVAGECMKDTGGMAWPQDRGACIALFTHRHWGTVPRKLCDRGVGARPCTGTTLTPPFHHSSQVQACTTGAFVNSDHGMNVAAGHEVCSDSRSGGAANARWLHGCSGAVPILDAVLATGGNQLVGFAGVRVS